MTPCMCGGCASCLTDQGYVPCPDCGAFGGCDCAEELPGIAKNVYTSPHEPAEDFDDREEPADERRCPECDRYLIGDVCGACREHERRRDDPIRRAELIRNS